MEILPAIDIRSGRSVRLAQGDFNEQTTYGDPVLVAESLLDAGARWLHLVDLDAAKTGNRANRAVVGSIAALASARGANVQVGGGIRSRRDALELLAEGASRVVIGTAAFERPELISELAGDHPGAIAVALDHRARAGRREAARRSARGGGRGAAARLAEREVAVRGWAGTSGESLATALGVFAERGAAAVVITDIARDGMLSGPDLEGLADVLDVSDVPVVASGGVRTVDDVVALASLESGGRRLAGAIVGKAISEGLLDLGEVLEACARSG